MTTATEPVRGTQATADGPSPGRWIALTVLSLAQLMVVLDATIVNIALPTAQRALAFSDDDRQWVVTAYALAFGSLLLLGGRLSDFFGRRTMFMVGLVGFAVASAVGGAAQGFGTLVAARAAQGAFAAVLAPAALSLLSTTFTGSAERAKAFGIFGAISGAGGAVGLLLGGVLTEYASWRWCLYVNLVIAAVALVGAWLKLSNGERAERPHLDLPGVVTVVGGLVGVVYGLANAEVEGWRDAATVVPLVGGVVLLAVFVAIERRVEHPLLPLRVVLDRNRGGSYLAAGLAGAGIFGVFLFLTYFLSSSLGFSPIQTGFAFLPMVGAIVLSATSAGSLLVPRFGPRPVVPVGMLVSALGMLLLTQIAVDSSYASDVLPGLVIVGLGLGLVFAPVQNAATSGVQHRDAGVASAMINTTQQIGGSIGTALLSSFAATASTDFLAGKAATAQTAAQAAVEGYTTVFWWTTAIFVAGAVVSVLLFRSGPLENDPDVVVVAAH